MTFCHFFNTLDLGKRGGFSRFFVRLILPQKRLCTRSLTHQQTAQFQSEVTTAKFNLHRAHHGGLVLRFCALIFLVTRCFGSLAREDVLAKRPKGSGGIACVLSVFVAAVCFIEFKQAKETKEIDARRVPYWYPKKWRTRN